MKTAQTTGNNKRSVLQDRPKIVVVMPAYNAAETLEATFRGIDRYLVDEIILVDDHSKDSTVNIARKLGVKVFVHAKNRGYGGNQKTCYREALRLQANIVVMLHPDGQYHPSLMGKLIQPILSGQADVVLGSRMLKPGAARRGGMPFYKYVANKALTAIENVILRQNLSEYHTGYRAFSREFLQAIPFDDNSDGYVFDTEMLVQAVHFRLAIHEIPISTRYFDGASSASFWQSTVYGLRTLLTLLKYLMHRSNLKRFGLFQPPAEKVTETIR